MLHREPRTRQRFSPTSWIALLGGIAGSLVTLLYTRYVEPNTLLTRWYELDFPALPPHIDGLKLAFLSDFHVGGPGVTPLITRRAIEAVEGERPDLILLGGDYYDDGKRELPGPDWSRFPAIAPTYAVLGNHDYNFGTDASEGIRRALEHSGITVLRNQATTIDIGDDSIGLIGVDDAFTDRADFEQANRQLDPHVHPRILLTHAGLLVDSLPIGSVDLIVSGHTHGGQVRVSPFQHTSPLDAFWWLDLVMRKKLSPYRQGMFYVRGALLFVSNGIGMTTSGVRFLAPPDVTFFVLRRGTGSPGERCDTPERFIRSCHTAWHYKPGRI